MPTRATSTQSAMLTWRSSCGLKSTSKITCSETGKVNAVHATMLHRNTEAAQIRKRLEPHAHHSIGACQVEACAARPRRQKERKDICLRVEPASIARTMCTAAEPLMLPARTSFLDAVTCAWDEH